MVIQRWQSVLLLIAVIVMAAFTFMSLGQIQLPEYTLNFTTLGFYIEGEATNGAATGYVANTWLFFIVSSKEDSFYSSYCPHKLDWTYILLPHRQRQNACMG